MRIAAIAVLSILILGRLAAQDNLDAVSIRLTKAAGSVYMAEGVGGFGGGNVAASIGPDGILLVDDMYAAMAPKLQRALATISPLPVRIVLNTHFHGDHIQANSVFGKTAMVIAHENVLKRLATAAKPLPFPMVAFADTLTIRFNGEDIRIRHLPTAHTDGDAIVFFEQSKVLHLGDMFFVGMFPAVYSEGGGDIRKLIAALDRVLVDYPADTKIVPGHGEASTMSGLREYVAMLKDTVAAAEEGIRGMKDADASKLADAIKKDPRMQKYAKLGDGGAQTVDQYVAMLIKLLKSS